jgi:acetate kinase
MELGGNARPWKAMTASNEGMPLALVFNPGSNSLKFELVELQAGQRTASEAKKLASAVLDDIGKGAKLRVYDLHGDGREIAQTEDCDAGDMRAAARLALNWLRTHDELREAFGALDFAGVRVVHGGTRYAGATQVNEQVLKDIEELEELAPLHNKSSLEILAVLREELAETPPLVTFDTAFHRTPETAWRYAIERETAERNGVRKFGFHGLSHRYMLEHYAKTVGKRPEEVSIVTLHLESGCSAAAIRNGQSVDTTMGLTPLEGLMMGSRSGSIDPAIVPHLIRKEGISGDEVMTLLNKRSGMLGIAGGTLDTRELVKRDDDAARLALAMFSYRVRLAVGAYLAALGDAEAVIFGGGIGEDSPWLRTAVCEGLGGWGLELDAEVNERSTAGQARISRDGSRLQAWAMPVEEGLQMAHECLLVLMR